MERPLRVFDWWRMPVRAYYNEFDPKAAATLRELIKQGYIADGDVDERSIEDVVPDELLDYTQVHLFAGFGLWSLAFRWAGIADDTPAWSCSCPCQPFSAAGQGKAFTDERHLWPAAFHLIQHAKRPEVPIYGEQVAGSRVMPWVDLVWSDLEAAGHTFRPVVLASAGFGSPIIRQRTFWVASTDGSGYVRRRRRLESDGRETARVESQRLCNADGLASPRDTQRWPISKHGENGCNGADAGRKEAHGIAGARSKVRWLGSPSHKGLQEQRSIGGTSREEIGGISRQAPERTGSSISRMAIADGRESSDRDLQRSGKQRFEPKDGSTSVSDGGPSPTNGFWRDADWLRCRDDKWRPVEASSQPMVNGNSYSLGCVRDSGDVEISQAIEAALSEVGFPLGCNSQARIARLRGYGNAISPVVAAYFIKAHLESEEREVE